MSNWASTAGDGSEGRWKRDTVVAMLDVALKRTRAELESMTSANADELLEQIERRFTLHADHLEVVALMAYARSRRDELTAGKSTSEAV